MQNRHKKSFTEVIFFWERVSSVQGFKNKLDNSSTVDPSLRKKERLYGLLMLESNFIKLNKSDGLSV